MHHALDGHFDGLALGDLNFLVTFVVKVVWFVLIEHEGDGYVVHLVELDRHTRRILTDDAERISWQLSYTLMLEQHDVIGTRIASIVSAC